MRQGEGARFKFPEVVVPPDQLARDGAHPFIDGEELVTLESLFPAFIVDAVTREVYRRGFAHPWRRLVELARLELARLEAADISRGRN